MNISLKSLSQPFVFRSTDIPLIILPSLVTLISFSAPNKAKLEAISSSKNKLASESIGIVERKSIVKLPFK